MSTQKKQLLLGINSIPVDDILQFIQAGDFTLQEAKDAGLAPATLTELENRQQELVKERAERERLDQEKVRQLAAARGLLQDVAAGSVDIEQLQEHLLEGRISEVDLLSLPGMTPELVRAVWNFERRVTDFAAWD